MSVPLFVGAYKMFRTRLLLGLAGVGRAYGTFYLGLGLFLFTISVTNSISLSPILLQRIIYFSLFGELYIALGFMYLFSFMLADKKMIGFILLGIHIFFAILFLYFYIPEASGVVTLLPNNKLFQYKDPGYSIFSTLFSLMLVISAASTYSRFLLKTGIASSSMLIRKRSFIFAIGSVIAAFSGSSYFISPLLLESARPYVVAVASIPGIVGFTLMVLPLFLKEKTKLS